MGLQQLQPPCFNPLVCQRLGSCCKGISLIWKPLGGKQHCMHDDCLNTISISAPSVSIIVLVFWNQRVDVRCTPAVCTNTSELLVFSVLQADFSPHSAHGVFSQLLCTCWKSQNQDCWTYARWPDIQGQTHEAPRSLKTRTSAKSLKETSQKSYSTL